MFLLIIAVVSLKVAVAISFIIAGSICLDIQNACSINRPTGVGFVGVGLGIIVSTIISAIYIWCWKYGFLLHGHGPKICFDYPSRVFFMVKCIIALMLIAIGAIIYHQLTDIGSGLIGVGFGLGFGAIISITIMIQYIGTIVIQITN